MAEEEEIQKQLNQLEEDIQKKLHMKRSDTAKSSDSSSSDSDEDVDMVMAILTPEFGDDFRCTAESNCRYEDPKSHPKGTFTTSETSARLHASLSTALVYHLRDYKLFR